MNTSRQFIRVGTAVALAALASLPVWAWGGRSANTPAATAAVEPAQYAGSETCKTCHEEIYKKFEATQHWKTTYGRHAESAKGCEACHGAGQAHVDKSKIFTFTGADAAEASRRCPGGTNPQTCCRTSLGRHSKHLFLRAPAALDSDYYQFSKYVHYEGYLLARISCP